MTSSVRLREGLDGPGASQTYRDYASLLNWIAVRKFSVPVDDVETIVSDAFMALLTAVGEIHDERAWLVGAACNRCRQYWRERQRHGELIEIRDTDRTIDVAALERTMLVSEVLRQMTPNDRLVLRMHYFEGLTDTEMAVRLDTTPGYARKRIVMALARARVILNVCRRADHARVSIKE